jgi:hypothetical protein
MPFPRLLLALHRACIGLDFALSYNLLRAVSSPPIRRSDLLCYHPSDRALRVVRRVPLPTRQLTATGACIQGKQPRRRANMARSGNSWLIRVAERLGDTTQYASGERTRLSYSRRTDPPRSPSPPARVARLVRAVSSSLGGGVAGGVGHAVRPEDFGHGLQMNWTSAPAAVRWHSTPLTASLQCVGSPPGRNLRSQDL